MDLRRAPSGRAEGGGCLVALALLVGGCALLAGGLWAPLPAVAAGGKFLAALAP